MPTHKTTLTRYKINRSIIPESFNKSSLVVSEIIFGQNHFLKNEKWQYLQTRSEIFKTLHLVGRSHILLYSLKKKSPNSIQLFLRNGSRKKYKEIISFRAKTGNSRLNFWWEHHFSILQCRLNVPIRLCFKMKKVEV
jgi:hypothetical protein